MARRRGLGRHRRARPLALDALAAFGDIDLGDLPLRLQPGLAYLASDWPVDELIKLRLSGAAPESFAFDPEDVCLEVRGARGDFRINRLAPAPSPSARAAAGGSARHALAGGETAEPTSIPARRWPPLFAENLVTAIDALKTERPT